MPKKRKGNGEGTIYQRKADNRWVGEVTTGYDPITGKRKRKVIYGKTRKEVSEKITLVLKSLQDGTYVEPNKITLGQWLDRWIEVFQTNLSPNFYARRKELIRLHIKPKIGKILLSKLRPSDIQKLYNELLANGRKDGTGGLSTGTIKHIHNIIKQALEQAVKEPLIRYNVAANVKPFPIVKTRKSRALTQEESFKYLNVLNKNRLFAAFLLELTSALRRGELLGLQWPDLSTIAIDNVEMGVLKINRQVTRIKHEDETSALEYAPLKTPSSYRTIVIPPITLSELMAHKERQEKEKSLVGKAYQDERLIFCTPLGGKLDTKHLYRLHCRALEKAKIEHISFHDLRHTVPTMLLLAGENIKMIQDLLGHADAETTLNDYSHVSEKMKISAAIKLQNIYKDVCISQPNINKTLEIPVDNSIQ